MTRVQIKEIEKIKLKDPIIIEGFPGIGMVGTIGASYLSEKLDMKLAGYLASTHFPPIAVIHNYRPVSPARIYVSEKFNLIVLFSEFVIPAEIVFPLSEEIISWAKLKKAKGIYSLAGIASDNPPDKIFAIASTEKMADSLKKIGVELIREGATQGVSGVLVAECAAQRFPAANIMVQTNVPLDPKGSARLLNKLSEIIGVKIDTKALETEGDKIEEKMKEALDKMKSLHAHYQEMEQSPMYG
ncbi:proteasome assembly chaperone family protein [Candidatus Micrarchaeota archaeon]|nr:proteasome assembly chaperone family protein [Candidatus Micrarchaeota archaeon]